MWLLLSLGVTVLLHLSHQYYYTLHTSIITPLTPVLLHPSHKHCYTPHNSIITPVTPVLLHPPHQYYYTPHTSIITPLTPVAHLLVLLSWLQLHLEGVLQRETSQEGKWRQRQGSRRQKDTQEESRDICGTWFIRAMPAIPGGGDMGGEPNPPPGQNRSWQATSQARVIANLLSLWVLTFPSKSKVSSITALD